MARKQLTDAEREKIKQSLIATRKRRKSQIVKVFELKVNCHQTKPETFKKFNEMFKQAKWVRNDMLALSKETDNNIFKYEYLEHKTIHRIDKDKNIIESNIDMPVYLHRAIINNVKQDICNLAKAKRKGLKVGALKFKSECNCIPIITGGIKILDNSHITIPGFKKLKVYGLHQILDNNSFELADGKIIRKASGIYIHATTCIDKNKSIRNKTYKDVGLDFGIRTNITTSDGDKFNCNVQESEYLKYLQKQLHRKQKDSKRYYRLRNQIKKEYEHLSNKKMDECNKLIHKLLSDYDIIYFQDEQISKWKKKKKSKKTGKKCGNSFGRQIQHSYLGRVKAKLVSMEGTRTFKIDKFQPTTKLCPVCGTLNDIGKADTYRCACGHTMDRDVHAARNVKMIGSVKRAECLEQASAETLSSAIKSSRKINSKLSRRSEKEDSNF